MQIKGSARADRLKNGSPRHSIGITDRSNNQKSMKGKLMKRKSFLFVALFSAAALISCQKENADNGSQKGDAIVFSAYVDGADPESKTVFGDAADGRVASLWSDTENIWVMDASQNNTDYGWKKQYHAVLDKASDFAVFSQTVTEGVLKDGPYWALYPSNTAGSATWDGDESSDVYTMWLNPSQTAVPGGYSPEYHVSVAYSNNTMLNFKNVVSFFKFNVANANISEVCIYSNDQKVNIAGNFKANWNNGNPTVTPDGNVKKPYVKSLVSKQTGDFYVAALPADLTGGITVDVIVDGNLRTINSTNKPYSLARNWIVDLGSCDYTGTAQTRTVYLNPGKWSEARALFCVYYWKDGNNGFIDLIDKQGDGRYEGELPEGVENYKFVRFNPDDKHNHNWDYKWSETGDLNVKDYNCYTVPSDSWDGKLSKIE